MICEVTIGMLAALTVVGAYVKKRVVPIARGVKNVVQESILSCAKLV